MLVSIPGFPIRSTYFQGGIAQLAAGQNRLADQFMSWIKNRRNLGRLTTKARPIVRKPETTGFPCTATTISMAAATLKNAHSSHGFVLNQENELAALCATWQNAACVKTRNQARQQVMEMFMPVAERMARPYGRLLAGLSYDDLRHEALLGLCAAMETYNPGHRVPFGAYARRRMQGAILDALRRWRRGGRGQKPLTLADIAYRETFAAIETSDLLSRVLAGLPGRQRRIVELHFVAEMPSRRIAELLGIHITRVGQLLRQAIAALRAEPQTLRLLLQSGPPGPHAVRISTAIGTVLRTGL